LAIATLYSFIDQYSTSGKFPSFLKASMFPEEKTEQKQNNSNQANEQEQPKQTEQNNSNNNSQPAEQEQEPQPKPQPEPKTPTVSPYIDKVKINRVKTANQYSPSLVTLSVGPYKGEPINITGWTIKTRKGTFTIAKGIEKYQKNMPLTNIIIKEQLYVYLIGDVSPLGSNQNFRTNKCFGYLNQSLDFYPSIYSSCPKPKLEDISHLNPYCQNFILHQYGCKMPNYSKDFKISTDSQCVSYVLDYFTYSGCFKRYSQDPDFLKNYWYVYLDRNFVQDYHDTVYLYDQYGLLVDQYTY
jgi:hypothetical protein